MTEKPWATITRVERWQTGDGALHDTLTEASAHVTLCLKVDAIMARLPPRPDSCDFQNGKLGYIQHDPMQVTAALAELIAIFCTMDPHHWLEQTRNWLLTKEEWPPLEAAHRIIGELPLPRLVRQAWERLFLTDKQYREWGQYYFCNAPEKAPVQTPYNPPKE